MRCLFLDEAGFSNPKEEPFAVVAGILVHGDRDFERLEAGLANLWKKWLPEVKERVVFHAMHIWHGSPPWTRARFSRAERVSIIRAINSLCAEHYVPVVMGAVDRSYMSSLHPNLEGQELQNMTYGVAAMQCVMFADQFLRQSVQGPAENALVIAEDRTRTRAMMREMQSFLQQPDAGVTLHSAGMAYEQSLAFPLRRIVDTYHLAEKRYSPMLQIADACAFSLKRRLMGCPVSDELCQPLFDELIVAPKTWPSLRSGGERRSN